jgi:hypothetical protein
MNTKALTYLLALLNLLSMKSYAQNLTTLQGSSHTYESPSVKLIDLNPGFGSEYILQFKGTRSYHLSMAENRFMRMTDYGKIHIVDLAKPDSNERCEELERAETIQAKVARSNTAPYISACKGQVFIRNKTNGYQSRVEWGSSLLRDNFGDLGEKIVDSVKVLRPDQGAVAEVSNRGSLRVGQSDLVFLPAKLSPQYQNASVQRGDLGIQTKDAPSGSLVPGQWYQAKNFSDFAVSVVSASMVDEAILKSHQDRVGNFDGVEEKNLVYLVAWQTQRFGLGWVHGTQHPGVEWSPRAVNIEKGNLLGPDGIDKLEPFIASGAVRPDLVPITIATFSGGFQRRHGAFKMGDLSKMNNAHHYGFIEEGVILSRLQPSLATFTVDNNGFVDLRTWRSGLADESSLRFARQNGVPLIEGGTGSTVGTPGRLVKFWGPGNWSGSADAKLRTPRAAACIVRDGTNSYLIYAYFSSATPNSMARVFQAYQCDDAIHLDMNSAGQSYFSLFKQIKDMNFQIEHLVKEMATVDSNVNGRMTPRYLIKSDYRDFFYLREK